MGRAGSSSWASALRLRRHHGSSPGSLLSHRFSAAPWSSPPVAVHGVPWRRRRGSSVVARCSSSARVSYGWYLWHWPVLVLAPARARARSFSWIRNVELSVHRPLVRGASPTSPLERPDPAGSRLAPRRWLGRVSAAHRRQPAAGCRRRARRRAPRRSSPATAPSPLRLELRTDAADLTPRRPRSTAASGNPSVPGNLTPDAREGRTPTSPRLESGCHLELPRRSTRAPCVYGDPHRDAHRRAVRRLARSAVAGEPSTPPRRASPLEASCRGRRRPAPSPRRQHRTTRRSSATYTECDTWRTQSTIARHPRLRSQTWSIVSQSDSVPGRTREQRPLGSDDARTRCEQLTATAESARVTSSPTRRTPRATSPPA